MNRESRKPETTIRAQKLLLDPDDTGAAADAPLHTLEEILERLAHLRTEGVEHAERAVLDQLDIEVDEIAHVDELHVIAAVARRHHRAAARDAYGPVGEAIGIVTRSDDDCRTNHRHATREDALRFLL